MKTIIGIGLIFVFIMVGQAFTATIAKELIESIDSTPGEPVIVDLKEWFSSHSIREGMARVDQLFESPRNSITLITTKNPKGPGRHIHSQTDEIIYVHKGSGEIFQNGKWVSVKAGDLHVCPRGVAHGLRATAGGEISVISIFTPPQPKGSNDRVMIQKFDDWFIVHHLYCGLNPNLQHHHISRYPGTTFKMSLGAQYQGSFITPGIDYCSNYMYAAADGKVIDIHKLDTGRLGGMIMDILHPETEIRTGSVMFYGPSYYGPFVTRYGHLGDVKVRVGDNVKRGSLLADTIDSNAAKFMLRINGNYVCPDNYGETHSFMMYFDGNNPTISDVSEKLANRTKILNAIMAHKIPETGLTEWYLSDKKHIPDREAVRSKWDDFEKFKFLAYLYEARPQYFPKLTTGKFAEIKNDFYANQPGILTLPLKA